MPKINNVTENKRFLISICGKTGSGKNTVLEYLKKEYGAHEVTLGNICRVLDFSPTLVKENPVLSAANSCLLSMEKEGLLHMSVPDRMITGDKKQIIAVVGVEDEHDILTLWEFADRTKRDVIPIYLDSPKETRLQRANEKRERLSVDGITDFSIRRKDDMDDEAGMDLIEMNGYTIFNGPDTSIQELQVRIDTAILLKT